MGEEGGMLFFVKALISGVIIAAASTLAKRFPGLGAIVASLPLVAILSMVWLWREKPDPATLAAFSTATFWFVLPSLPMFLIIPVMLRNGAGFWPSLLSGCVVTAVLYLVMRLIVQRFGVAI